MCDVYHLCTSGQNKKKAEKKKEKRRRKEEENILGHYQE
jgi:hypothetical protein